ncbi:hypothetical protein F5146DRAFT_53321 [Armillaria mellea]|nr:hypothetical protein F5146DRAFT_346491 [Armillaria mellea]KAK0197599.1 hypothetical protein F5146DRAFT_53321 [Armillaria mellea]
MKPFKISYRSYRPSMSFPFFPLCIFMMLLPLVLSLNRAPEALQSTHISLHGIRQSNPGSDCLGAWLTHTLQESVKVTTKDGTVGGFAADQIINITLCCTTPSGKDCNLFSWLQELCPCFAKPELSVGDPTGQTASKSTSESDVSPKPTSKVSTSLFGPGEATPTVPVAMNMPNSGATIPSESGSSPSAYVLLCLVPSHHDKIIPHSTATPGRSKTKAIPPETIVGIAVGSFAFLLSMLLAFFVWQRRNSQKAKESAPSRVFWRSLDGKSPPV